MGKFCFYTVPLHRATCFGVKSHERSRRPTNCNGANDSSHHQLFEAAIRLEEYLFLQKLGGFRPDQTGQVSRGNLSEYSPNFLQK